MTRVLAAVGVTAAYLLVVRGLDWWGRELNSHECVEVTR